VRSAHEAEAEVEDNVEADDNATGGKREVDAKAPPPELVGVANPLFDFASRWLNVGGGVNPYLA
jgi:hypothetical protein